MALESLVVNRWRRMLIVTEVVISWKLTRSGSPGHIMAGKVRVGQIKMILKELGIMNHMSKFKNSSRNKDLILNYFHLLILCSSDIDAECLDIRTTDVQTKYRNAHFFNFLNRNGKRFYWGPSVVRGFHCFNGLQDGSEKCEDFEYRIFKDCDFS